MAQVRPKAFDVLQRESRKVRDVAADRARVLRSIGQSAEGSVVIQFLREAADEPVYTPERDAVAMAYHDGRRALALLIINHMEGRYE